MLTNKRIGVVGGSGYLGRHLTKMLCRDNPVRIIDLRAPESTAHANVTFARCDITRKEDCIAALEGLDIVFHKAGLFGNLPSMKQAGTYYQTNVVGTLHVLSACVANKVERLIFDSTEFVYGNLATSPITEDQPARPCSIYGATKLIGEHAARMYNALYGLPVTIFRYCRVRDPSKDDVITALAGKIMNGEEITLLDEGLPAFDFVDIADVTAANIDAASLPPRSDVMNISSGEAMSLNEIVSTIRNACGVAQSRVRYQSAGGNPPSAEYLFGPRKLSMSVEKAKALLGWQPKVTMRSSIEGTVRHLTGNRRSRA